MHLDSTTGCVIFESFSGRQDLIWLSDKSQNLNVTSVSKGGSLLSSLSPRSTPKDELMEICPICPVRGLVMKESTKTSLH